MMAAAHEAFWPPGLPKDVPLPDTSLYFNLEVTAARYPAKPATIFYGAVLSYGELLRQVDQLAGYLQQCCGVGQGDRVLLYSQNAPQFIIGYYAVLRAGGVVVPANPMSITAELRHYLLDSGARTALVARELLERILPLQQDGTVEHVVVHTYSDYLDSDADIPAPEAVTRTHEAVHLPRVTDWNAALARELAPGERKPTADDLAVLAYTSGTTGQPKGCVHSHRTVLSAVASSQLWRQGHPASTTLAVAPLFHFLGMQGGMNNPIYNGASIALLQRWDRDAALQLIERSRVYSWSAPPAMIVDFFANPAIREHDISSLQVLMGGGAAMPEAVSRRLKDDYGIRFNEAYGLTETAAFILGNPLHRGKRQCLGVPTFGVDARIVDPATLEELPQGEVGELILAGPQVMLRYWNNEQATASAFIERAGRRFLRTGDLACVDEEGYFFMKDRLKRMINVSGYKVWPAEVENIMYGHPAIHEACVIGMPDARQGESVKVVAVLRPEQQGQVSEQDIIAWCREHMAAYKVPRVVEFADSLPKSATGKVQWRELQEAERSRSAP
ncbi:MAG: long-chain fatty acid--CoA ligase [Ectothiorhodospiraceae bacterium]|nr:long-chain fatty acid--CoA ligase [Ectothiorhodospiraceae bacterium]MCH8503976.1 long-chain fatty acid--CoA ligase [Ectothiorhodospiraceae bacterium]